jgi:hypothetical protein
VVAKDGQTGFRLPHSTFPAIRRHLQIEFPEFREQRAKVTVQPARKLRQIRLLKLVKHPPRILQVAQGFLVVLLDFLPDARAIHPHQRTAMVARMGVNVGRSVGLLSGGAAWH